MEDRPFTNAFLLL